MTDQVRVLIPLIDDLYSASVESALATDFVRYCTAYAAMKWRTNAEAVTQPGGLIYRIRERWMTRGFARESDLAQMADWLDNSHHLTFLSIDQVGDLLWTGYCDLVDEDNGERCEFDSGLTDRQLARYKDSLHILLGGPEALRAPAVAGAIEEHAWGEALELLGCDERHLREYLALLMNVRAFPRVRKAQIDAFESRGAF